MENTAIGAARNTTRQIHADFSIKCYGHVQSPEFIRELRIKIYLLGKCTLGTILGPAQDSSVVIRTFHELLEHDNPTSATGGGVAKS